MNVSDSAPERERRRLKHAQHDSRLKLDMPAAAAQETTQACVPTNRHAPTCRTYDRRLDEKSYWQARDREHSADAGRTDVQRVLQKR
jgi:hypothetical protein